MQSGSDRSEWAVIEKQADAKYYAQELAREIGCPTGDMFRLVQCLQLYRTDMEIVNASTKIRLKVGGVQSLCFGRKKIKKWGKTLKLQKEIRWIYPCLSTLLGGAKCSG